jgi:hydrogenase 3 maturation protease
LKPSWKVALTQALNPTDPGRIAILGIGNELNGDDALGVLLARKLSTRLLPAVAPTFLILEAGSAPENLTFALRRFAPRHTLLIDAAQMDEAPGAIRYFSPQEITGIGAFSHALPLSALAAYLTAELGCTVGALGVQPAHNDFDTPLSPPVRAAMYRILGYFTSLWG